MDISTLLTVQSPFLGYYLCFLLGTLTVSSLSDLRRMAAQSDFAEVWAIYTGVMFISDLALGLDNQMSVVAFLIKWVLVIAFAAISSGVLHVATMDVAAMSALVATADTLHLFLTIPALMLVNEILKPLLRRYGEAGAYPFLPTVLATNILLFAAWYTQILGQLIVL